MARINKAKNFAGKSYVVSNEVEDLIKTLTFDVTNSTLKFGATTVSGDSVTLGDGVSFADWISAAKTAAAESAVTTVVGTAADDATANTVYGAKADATAKANKALEDAKDYADNIADAAISVAAGDGIVISSQEGSTTKTISTDIQLVSVTAADGATATYALQIKEAGKETYKSVGTIDIPKDMVATTGVLVDRKEGETEASGTYIKMTIANGEAFYIDVADLIEYNSYADSDTISFAQVEGEAHQYKFSVVDGSITTAKIADANVTTAKIADANVTTVKIADANVTAAKLSDDAKALFDAAGTAQGLIEALDSEKTAATGKYISGITQVDGKITEIIETALGSAAFAETTAFDAAGAAAAVLGSDTDAATANTVYGAKAAAAAALTEAQGKVAQESGKELALTTDIAKWNATSTEVDSFGDIVTHNVAEFEEAGAAATAKGELLGSDSDAAGAATIAGANKAAAAAQAAADEAQADADKIATAVNTKAVQFLSSDVALSATTTSGTVNGRVIAVYDADGVQVYPEITFASDVSTITVDGLAASETFTVIYATTITIA